MSAGGLTAASGLLQGFAQSYTAARIRATQLDVEQRHGLAQSLMSLYPNARPEAQADIAQRLLTIYSTPPGKKLDKKLSDIGSLGQAATQQNMNAQATQQGQQPPTPQPQPAGPTPMPDMSGTAAAGAGAPPQVGSAQAVPTPSPAIPLPPDLASKGAAYSPLMSPAERNQADAAHVTAMQTAEVGSQLAARKQYADAMGLTGRDRENFIAGRMVTPYAHQQQKMYVDPDNPGQPRAGNFDPISGVVTDMDGQVIENPQPWITAVNSPSTPFRAYMKAGLSQGRTTEELLNEYNTRKSSITGVRMVQQPDGSIQAVPVETSTTTTRGQLPLPPGSPQSKGAPGGGGSAKVGQGVTVGGKIPAEVDKAQTTYQQSVSRYNVMVDALPRALAGDQQAMINLLYNHIGMTTGLQKGARITRDIIEEARTSAQWMATLLARIGIGNGFEMSPELLRGVVIPPETMENMVSLAENRLQQDYRSFVDTRDYHASGGSALPKPPSDVVNAAKVKNAKPGTTTVTPSAKPNVASPPLPPKAAVSATNPMGI
jgi:hypothetical protein